jgi:hypothetical protein
MAEDEKLKTNQPDGDASPVSQGENITSGGSHAQRRSQWQASLDALAYINSLNKKSELKIRDSDHITALALFCASLATVLCLLLHKLSGLNLQLTLLCDLFLGIALIVYVSNRLGILTAMGPRQALLTWQLIKAFSFVGVFITLNLAIILSLVLACAPLSTFNPFSFH